LEIRGRRPGPTTALRWLASRFRWLDKDGPLGLFVPSELGEQLAYSIDVMAIRASSADGAQILRNDVNACLGSGAEDCPPQGRG
jgi:hypothetical protein